MDRTELCALIATDSQVRHLLVQLLRKDLLEQRGYLDPASNLLMVPQPPPGMITYAEGAAILGVKPEYIRVLVSRAHVHGGAGLVDRAELVRHALSNCNKRIRQHVVDHLKAEREQQAVPAEQPEAVPA